MTGMWLFFLNIVTVQATFKRHTECLNREHPPCHGAAGSCIFNDDGQPGGFVADTATVSSRRGRHAYIHLDAEVCDHASVSPYARIDNSASIRDSAHIEGNATVQDKASVIQEAMVLGPVLISDNAIISGSAVITSYAHVRQNAHITEHATITGHAQIAGNAKILGYAQISQYAEVRDYAHVSGHAMITNHARIGGTSLISGHTLLRHSCILFDAPTVLDHATIEGRAVLSGNSIVANRARISGTSFIQGNAAIFENATIVSDSSLSDASWIAGEEKIQRKIYLHSAHTVRNNRIIDEQRPTYQEASVLFHAFAQRKTHSDEETWLDEVILNDQTLSIDELPSSLIDSWILKKAHEPALFQSIISQAEDIVLRSPTELQIFEDTMKSLPEDLKQKISCAFGETLHKSKETKNNPLFQLRKTSPVEQLRIRVLRLRIEQGLRQSHWTQNPAHRDAAETTDYNIWLYDNTYDYITLLSVLEAIESQTIDHFIHQMVSFISSFPENEYAARQGFLESFTHLYVTGLFPSEGIRQTYYHFILRCGHLY